MKIELNQNEIKTKNNNSKKKITDANFEWLRNSFRTKYERIPQTENRQMEYPFFIFFF